MTFFRRFPKNFSVSPKIFYIYLPKFLMTFFLVIDLFNGFNVVFSVGGPNPYPKLKRGAKLHCQLRWGPWPDLPPPLDPPLEGHDIQTPLPPSLLSFMPSFPPEWTILIGMRGTCLGPRAKRGALRRSKSMFYNLVKKA